MKRSITLFFLFFTFINLKAQPHNLNSSEVFLNLQRLATVGNVMYVAAHPDDENTLMITWLSKERHLRTAYFAMTRGDGGQNLIGAEQGEFVGLLRTHELLEARKVDGGEQYFSRALDFGFSKSTDETLEFWDKEKVLGDLVYRIRKFQPDIIINRFPPDERAGHGHHSSSAVLSIEAFDLAADPNAYLDQLSEVNTWQVKRLFWNTFGGGFTNPEPDNTGFLKINLGTYNSLLGESYPELAARARSKHRSQGFGSAPSRGQRFDYLIPVKGEPAVSDPFDGIDLSWNRLDGGREIDQLITKTIKDYDFKNPSASVNNLLTIYGLIKNMPSSIYKDEKIKECVALILDCSGLYLEANSVKNYVSPGENLTINLSATKRSDALVVLKSLKIFGVAQKDTVINAELEYNKPFSSKIDFKVPNNAPITQPYWLKEEPNKGSYNISDEKYRSLPMAPEPFWAEVILDISGTEISFTQPVKFKYTEPSRGEIYKYLEIRSDVTLNFDKKVYVSSNGEKIKVGLHVKNNINKNSVIVKLNIPEGWEIYPDQYQFDFTKAEDQTVFFDINPSKAGGRAEIAAQAVSKNGTSGFSHNNISYEHVPELNTYPKAVARVIVPDLKSKGNNIGYIMGAGDEVPESLSQMGYDVTIMGENNVQGDLSKYDAIVVGVRAYNTENWLLTQQNALMEYVKNGGTLLTQYQTQAYFGTIKIDQIGPYPITINRGRVTEEDAEVRFINPDDPVLNYPNKITKADFEDWVQERGLYFAEKWSNDYTAVLSMNDKGEEPLAGSLLYSKYGKGYFVFTGLSFFRQLPAGVPGAYRLVANLLSIGK